jgi:hypothetical protein
MQMSGMTKHLYYQYFAEVIDSEVKRKNRVPLVIAASMDVIDPCIVQQARELVIKYAAVHQNCQQKLQQMRGGQISQATIDKIGVQLQKAYLYNCCAGILPDYLEDDIISAILPGENGKGI